MKKILVLIIIFCTVFCTRIKSEALSTSAKAAVLVSSNGENIIYGANENMRLPMASTTKIMTAVIVLENADLSQIVTVGDEVTVEGTSAGLVPGDNVSVLDLMYAMMLPSGNDAANALAVFVGKNVDGFVTLMNKKARELELNDTHFETPSGLDGENHYTSAYDLARLTAYAIRNPDFKKICSTKEKTLSFGSRKVNVKNHNRLIFEEDCIFGVKTGFTKKSGRCLVTAAEKDGNIIIAVTLNDGNDWEDHRNLIKYGFENLEFTDYVFLPRNYIVPTCNKGLNIEAYSNTVKFTYCVGDKITYTVNLLPFIYPEKCQDIIGAVKFYKNGIYLTETPIKAKPYEFNEEKNGILSFFLKMLKLIFV